MVRVTGRRGGQSMRASRLVRLGVVASIVTLLVTVYGVVVHTPQRGGTPETDKVPPINSGANPYRVIRDWAQLSTEGRMWGGSNGVAIDRDGKDVWATDRCLPGTRAG